MTHRPAQSAAEIQRAGRVLGGDEALPPDARWFLAFAPRPVERIVGAAVWWMPEVGGAARFRWSLIHAHATGGPAVAFLNALAAEAASHSAPALCTAIMLPPDSAAAVVLVDAGFAKAQQNKTFDLPVPELRARAHRVGERVWKSRAQELAEAGVRLLPLTQANAETVWAFIAPHGLMTPPDFASALKSGGLRDFSVVLEAGGRVCGAYLCQRLSDEVLTGSVFVVAEDAAIPQEVGSTLIMHAWAARPGCERGRVLHIRADPVRNPATPRLALRYGGHQTGELWSYERKLTP